MIIKIGNVNIAGPGFIVEETNNNNNRATVGSSDGFVCSTDDGTGVQTFGFTVYAQQGCSIERAFELYRRVQDELAVAAANSGHLVYLFILDKYKFRNELKGGNAIQVQFGLMFRTRRTVAFELTITVADTRIVGPTSLKNIGGGGGLYAISWVSDTIRAKLVMTNSTAKSQRSTAVHISDITNLDEFDGVGYTELTLTNKTLVDGIYRSSDLSFGLSQNGTRQIQGIVLYRPYDNLFIGYIDEDDWQAESFGTGLFDPEGNAIIFPVNVYGLVKA